MEIIREVEEQGGMRKAIASGMAKLRIEEAAAKKQARIDSGEDIIVGVNKYQLSKDADSGAVNVLKIDNSAVKAQQIARLNKIKSTRNTADVEAALSKLTKTAADKSSSNNLLGVAVEAARARATVGEISDAMEKEFGRYVAKTRVVSGAYSASHKDQNKINSLLDRVKKFENEFGRRPRILVAKMGQDGHDRGAKVIASGFADLGFDVDIGALFATPEEVCKQAVDCDVHVVGVSSQAAGHLTLVPELIQNLRKNGAGHMVVVAGGVIPPEDYDAMYKAGVSCVFGPGTKITDACETVVDTVESKLRESGRM